jgi:hypothetical protein
MTMQADDSKLNPSPLETFSPRTFVARETALVGWQQAFLTSLEARPVIVSAFELRG